MNMCKFYEWKLHLKGRIWFAPFRKNSLEIQQENQPWIDYV